MIHFLLSLFLGEAATGAPDAVPREPRESDLVFVYRQGERVFVLSTQECRAKTDVFWGITIAPSDEEVTRYKVRLKSYSRGLECMYLSKNCLWFKCGGRLHQVFLKDLAFHGPDWFQRRADYRTAHPGTTKFDREQWWPVRPIDGRPERPRYHVGGIGAAPIQDKRFDGFPLGDHCFQVFSPDDTGSRIDVWETTGEWDKETGKWKDEWELTGEIIQPGLRANYHYEDKKRADMMTRGYWEYDSPSGKPKREFYSFRRGLTYFFLTDTAEVFYSPYAKDNKRKLIPMETPKWNPDRIVVFTDSDKDRTFLLVSAAKSDVIHFAELKEDIRFTTFPLKDLAPLEAKEPIRSVRHALQVLRERNLIADK
ncbi:MAG: hypothetical protein U0793_05510 [Gemmataceae bacterium]